MEIVSLSKNLGRVEVRPTVVEPDVPVHQPVRTRIAAYLAARGEATFNELKKAIEITDGNLEAHMKKLIGAGFIDVSQKPGKEARVSCAGGRSNGATTWAARRSSLPSGALSLGSWQRTLRPTRRRSKVEQRVPARGGRALACSGGHARI